MTSCNTSILIRPACPSEALALRQIFYASVHGLVSADYSQAQRDAWVSSAHDAAQWAAQIAANQPFVALLNGQLAGYSDLQDDGYIDHFFVDAAYARRGVARALMAHIHQLAAERGLLRLWANVSLTAEPFFAGCGFVLEQRQQVEVAGVVLANARMGKDSPNLPQAPAPSA